MKKSMKKLTYVLLLIVVLSACNDNSQKRKAENEKALKKKELIFTNISKAWDFYDEPVNETAEESVKNWGEFRAFLAVLAGKPKKTIGAFQLKSAAISEKAMALNTNIPIQFDKPQIKSRIAALITKVRMLDLYIHLDDIPDKKVIQLIGETNRELASLQRQMDNIVERGKIPLEEGEAEMRRMLLDSARAIPNNPGMPYNPSIPNYRYNAPNNRYNSSGIIDENTPRVE